MFVLNFTYIMHVQWNNCDFSYTGLKTQVRLAIESGDMHVGYVEYMIILQAETLVLHVFFNFYWR